MEHPDNKQAKRKNHNFPLASPGFLSCMTMPFVVVAHCLEPTPLRGGNYANLLLASVVGAAFILSALLLVYWGIWSSNYNWQSIAEEEREAFLLREKKQGREVWKFRGWICLFMLFCSSVVATLAYSVQSLWKPPALSFGMFLSIDWVVYLLASVAALVWLQLCDGKLRKTLPLDLR